MRVTRLEVGWIPRVAAVLLLIGGAGSAEAAGIAGARFSRMTLDPRLEREMRIEGGSVLVDRGRRELTLTLERGFECRGEFCATVMPEPVLIRLPIVSIEKDECGRIITRADREAMSTFVGRQRIVMVESGTSVCGGVDASVPTVVTLETEFQRVATRSRFEAPELERMPQILPIEE